MKTSNWKSVVKEYQKKMGADEGILYSHLLAEFMDLNYKWDEFVELFGTNKERIDILNKSASQFWAHTHNILFDDILIHIAKLTDPETTCGKKNLSIQTLRSIKSNDEKFDRKLKKFIDRVLKDTKFCRDWRNRRIAHIDYNYRTNNKTKLKSANRAKVLKCISGIYEVLNLIESHFIGSELHIASTRIYGAYDLLCVIDDGVRFVEEREARLRAGKVLTQDYQISKRSWS